MRKAFAFLALLTIVSAFLSIASPSFANTAPVDNPSVPKSTTSVTIHPVADTYVSAVYPGTNYGTGTTLRHDGSPIVTSFLRFSVSGMSSISHVILKLYANSSLSTGLDVHQVSDNSWGETTMTFMNAPATLGPVIYTSGAVTAGTWVSFDVTPYIKTNGTFSLAITDSNATAISLASRESTNPPQLVMTAGTAATATPTKAATATPTKSPSATATPGGIGVLPPNFSHVYTILMENKEYSSIVGSSSAPYVNSLIAQYGLATNYTGVAHPSEPNYIALFSGSTNGVTNDGTYNLGAKNIADEIEASGRTWKMFAQNVPLNCYTGSTASGGEDGSGNYARKHEPAISFTSISGNASRCGHITDFTHFDPAAANYEFITPNMCNDMHDCSVSTGDSWLKGFVPKILNSPAWQNGGVLFITWDEGTSNTGGGGHVATLVIGKNVPAGFKTSTAFSHYSLLHTIETGWSLPCLANTCSANTLAEFFH